MATLGKEYADGELIVRQGESGDCMYVIQEGEVEVVIMRDGQEIPLAVRKSGEFFGEMAIFERETRSASVRARGRARVLTVDRRQLLSRIEEDPALAMRLIQDMSRRIRHLSAELARLKSDGPG
ncbi:MAG TPA: cyclic nucleotide-binding domain-containing protein [Candidatus Krumholzibacteria bacterium]|nr:cyclic nucleotide-binding domain-containing protein [Candidatus Krumholzibacteria bacterium]